ncbi:hypothetical protein CMI40_02260 [Candidatus Pacearchaeota archaeon]|jgi:intein/homing endonuclease|nr:hypothetical protein [Candidatus Pacearchaeota archaeon]|tara:strand:- start:5084 stop:5650 length:567 start_codon:yes stop_codon:yes gene_type:complete
MDKKKLALFLGMLCGDGCLTINTKSKGGYKTYAICFSNSNRDLMINFQDLFLKVFEVKGNHYTEFRESRKVTYSFRSYSREVFDRIVSLGFPIGLKKYKLRIPQIILNLSREEKILFLKGFIITDGSIRAQGNVLFHVATKKFLEDISNLIYELFNLRKPIKKYVQKGKYLSYQLLLNKKEAQEILNY